MLDEHGRGVRAWHNQLWNLLMLESWHRMFIDQRAQPPGGDSGVGASHAGVAQVS